MNQDSSFTGKEYGQGYPDGCERNYWNLSRNRLIESILRRHRVLCPILDVGCGRGIVVDHLRRTGLDVEGCDPGEADPLTPSVAAHLHLSTSALELPRDLARSIKTILLLDVVEHLEDPHTLIGDCLEAFENSTHYLLTVPARREIWSEWDDRYGHKRRYDLESLDRLLTDVGLDILDTGYFFHSLYLAARFTSLLGISRKTVVEAPQGTGELTAHRLVASFLSAESALLPATWPGSSLYALARRRF